MKHNHPFFIGERVWDDNTCQWATVSMFGGSEEEGSNFLVLKNDNGDLNNMLYSFYGELEENYDYGLSQQYAYDKEGATVEDGWIVTTNPNGTGKLLMFRDSFANTLIPFLSNEFAESYYSKGFPNALERFVETHDPDCVVIQKVERNIAEYLENPPILTPPEAELPNKMTLAETETTVQIEQTMNDINYYRISGTVDATRMAPDSEILVSVDGVVYRAYLSGVGDFSLYVKKANFAASETRLQVYILNADHCIQALSTVTALPNA